MFAPGFDAKQRNVLVKIIVKDSSEERINLHLSQCKELYDCRAFACVVPPIAIVRSPHRFSFLVMPLWGYRFRASDLDTVQGVMDFIRCMLTGLSFLHEHRIAHRDIHDANILVNWYCYHDVERNTVQQELRRQIRSRTVTYALFDFNLSLQLPPGTSLKTCQRPASEGLLGVGLYHPDDIYQGQPYYNPFAYDVGCLGFMFIHNLTDAIPAVPMLAPLFGKMTTHIVDDRFTAAEALEFFRRIEAEVSPETLQSSVTLQPDYQRMHDPKLYWCRTSPEFRSLWESHFPPPHTWRFRLFRWIASTPNGFQILAFTRRILRL
ncbi:kinase-like domain-containing protein [Trametes polyzona]|nr:kinase-like domain-containing protein [Trametes polyzona]